VLGFDTNQTLRAELINIGGTAVDSIAQLCRQVSVVWVMVPVDVVDTVLEEMLRNLAEQSVIIDGGNSYYKDSITRANRCLQHNIDFLDCGTSGGIHAWILPHGGRIAQCISTSYAFVVCYCFTRRRYARGSIWHRSLCENDS
jgi:6-phosphogluconate dehydrogenase